MSHQGLSLFVWGVGLGLRKQAEFELGELGEISFLRHYMTSEDGKLAPEKLGRRIDDGLVEYIRLQLLLLGGEGIGVE